MLVQHMSQSSHAHMLPLPDDDTELCNLIVEASHDFGKLLLPVPKLNILGDAEWSCDDAAVKFAFRVLSLRVHPDKCSIDSTAAFLAVQGAYQTLRDEKTRAAAVRAFSLVLQANAAAHRPNWVPSSDAVTLQASGIDAAALAAATSLELSVAAARSERRSAELRKQRDADAHQASIVSSMQQAAQQQASERGMAARV